MSMQTGRIIDSTKVDLPTYNKMRNKHFINSLSKAIAQLQGKKPHMNIGINKIGFFLGGDNISLRNYIETNIKPIRPRYEYDVEKAMNPVYQDIKDVRCPLVENEKRMWVFRTDFILATGIKNFWNRIETNTTLRKKISDKSHKFINWEDRYGHPSLTFPYDGYDGSAYYAGFLAQKQGFMLVYLRSGRFYRLNMPEKDRTYLEAYISKQLMRTYGAQNIVFVNQNKNEFNRVFLADKMNFKRRMRCYSPKDINTLAEIEKEQDDEALQNAICDLSKRIKKVGSLLSRIKKRLVVSEFSVGNENTFILKAKLSKI